MSAIVAKRLVEHLQRSGFVVMKRPPIAGGTAPGRGTRGLTRAKILASVAVDFSTLKAAGAVL
jgi:hypothetical protein